MQQHFPSFPVASGRGKNVGTQTLSERIHRLTVVFNRASRVPWYVPCLLLLRYLIVSTMILTISNHANPSFFNPAWHSIAYPKLFVARHPSIPLYSASTWLCIR